MDIKWTVIVLALLSMAMFIPTAMGQADHGPSLTVTYPPDGLVTKAVTVTVNGTTNGTSITVNGVKATLTAKNYTLQVAIHEGTNSLLIQASDAGGNKTAKAITVVRDTAPPVIAVTSPHFPLVTNKRTIPVEGYVEKGCRVDASNPFASYPWQSVLVLGDAFSFDISLGGWFNGTVDQNMSIVWQVRATDPAGNERTINLPFRFDDHLNLTVTTRFDHDYHLNATESKDLIETYYDRIYIEGKTDPGANVTVNGNPIKVLANGSFVTYVDLKLGKNNISIAVTDEAGNNLTGYLNVKRYFWEPFVVPVEMAGTLLILGLLFGTVGGFYYGRHKERAAQAKTRAKAEEAARIAQRAQRPKATAPPKPKAEVPEHPEKI